ncbi:glutathione S-transferase [Spizellomyces punctatus DAOM BR117]|uniref:Glutathione S-transferase n=1 Tax=Spizellomyces punctatus (strain DAOM BR117) TaxID=645134 RepID=A0A0L0HUZ6_SPIPD|nr:glutathione S-transferase [Spizellomyces punctatus DAOM BR117]KND04720.1 glutathione S-transferase [Spizellomyces punctatus DAOM BR117]|eukprot:XP_016612759.1 glutathione S-transferase [Spizellomyces punctatus DAOM BR117]
MQAAPLPPHISPVPSTPGAHYTLVGSHVSLFTAKLRSYLIHKGLPFQEVLPTAKVYAQVILPRTGIAMIPVLVSPDGRHVWGDTKCITDLLEENCGGMWMRPPVDQPKQRFVTDMLELWADEWAVMCAMHYRWSFPEQRKFIEWEFGRTSGLRGTEEEICDVGRKLSGRFSGLLPILGVTPTTIPTIERQFQRLVRNLKAHIGKHDYLLGGRATLADCALAGPLYAHLLRDPIPGTIIKTTAPSVADYIERAAGFLPSRGHPARPLDVIEHSERHEPIQFKNAPAKHIVLPNDAIPTSLFPLLLPIFRDTIPYVITAANALHEWIARHPDAKEVPRSVGTVEFKLWDEELGWVVGRRQSFTHTVWMAKRLVNTFNSLNQEGKNDVREFLRDLEQFTSGGEKVKALDCFEHLREAVERCDITAKGALVIMKGVSGGTPRL